MPGTGAPRQLNRFGGANSAKSEIEDALCFQFLTFGPLQLATTLTRSGALAAVRLPLEPPSGLNAEHLQEALRSLQEIPVVAPNSKGQDDFRSALCKIPLGATASYGDLAALLHTSPRAIASRCSANPLLLRIPCHRVAAKTTLGGFQLGPHWKSLLLRLESELSKGA